MIKSITPDLGKVNFLKSPAPLLFLLIMLLSACVTEGKEDNEGLVAGDKLPQFTVTLNNGETVTTSSLRGKKVLIEFFNTTCADCQQSLPTIDKLYRNLRDDEEIAIFAIARDENPSEIEAYWQENKLILPYSPQPDRKVYEQFATVGIPRIFIAAPDGTITATFGPDDRPTVVQLSTLLSN